jgi:hypothetical protein
MIQEPTTLNLNEYFFSENFFFEELFIKILFLKNFPKISLISNSFGPFKKGTKTTIKIWIAILLKKTNWCMIEKPFWLNNKVLEKKILMEQKKIVLQDLPYYYLEYNLILYLNFREIFSLPEKTLNLIKELCCIRLIKISNGLHNLPSNIKLITFEKIGSFELLTIKKFIQSIFFMSTLI